MLTKLPGNKIGMTQLFDDKARAVAVTVIKVANWFVGQVKTQEREGYNALVLVQVRKKYQDQPFNLDWLRDKKQFFANVREVPFAAKADVSAYKAGQKITLDDAIFAQGTSLDVTGTSIGKGFQGVVKRWNFKGGPKSHGSKFHRIPGSSGNTRSQGMVPKGKRFPGHCGERRVTLKGLTLLNLDKEAGVLFVKGSVPGKSGSLVIVGMQG